MIHSVKFYIRAYWARLVKISVAKFNITLTVHGPKIIKAAKIATIFGIKVKVISCTWLMA